MKPRIIITIEGGICQKVESNTDIEYIVVDYDDSSEDGVIITGPSKQERLFRGGYAYKLLENSKLPISEEETVVIAHLKEYGF